MQDSFKDLLIESLGAEAASTALDALEEAPAVSVRYNQAKYPAPEGEAVAWNADGRFLAERPVFTLDPLLHAGAYYVQDSSAMFVGRIFREILALAQPEGQLRVLDLCAVVDAGCGDDRAGQDHESRDHDEDCDQDLRKSFARMLLQFLHGNYPSSFAVISLTPVTLQVFMVPSSSS